MHPTRPLPPPPPPRPPTAERNTRPFLKAFGFALPIVAVIFVWAVTSHDDPEAAGELAGGLSVAPLLGGLAVGIWARLATRRWHWPDYALRFAICTIAFFGMNALGQGMLGFASRVAPSAEPVFVALTDAEKQGISLGGGWIRHRQFGFTIPVGDKVDFAPEIQDEMNRQIASVPGTFSWAFEHTTDGVLIVYVAKGAGGDRASFSAFTRGLGKGTAAQATAVFEDDVRWGRDAREFRHGANLANGVYSHVRCVPSDEHRKPPYVVCVHTLSPDSAALNEARSFLKVPTWTLLP